MTLNQSLKRLIYLDGLTPVNDLKDNHPVKQYVIKRKIPEKYFSKLFLCNKFMAFVNKSKAKYF